MYQTFSNLSYVTPGTLFKLLAALRKPGLNKLDCLSTVKPNSTSINSPPVQTFASLKIQNFQTYPLHRDSAYQKQPYFTTRSCDLQRGYGKPIELSRPRSFLRGKNPICTVQARPYSTTLATRDLMSSAKAPEGDQSSTEPARHKPLVVGLTKPKTDAMASTEQAQELDKAISENVATNTESAAPAGEKQGKKKEKAPKQPKAPKAAPVAAPTTPALIDLRVGHILRAIAHPNADTLYVSTIAMGDAEGTEHTEVDKETGKVVRTVCSGLKAYIPLEEMQDRKIIVVANLKPVNMRSIKSAAMVLAASPKQEEGADAHAPDRVVELVVPPTGSEAGDKVYFEGWPYGEGKGPEKQLNPKKKQWEAIQPGFYTSDDLKVGFDAGVCEEVEGSNKGFLVVEGKGPCTVPTLKGAVVR